MVVRVEMVLEDYGSVQQTLVTVRCRLLAVRAHRGRVPYLDATCTIVRRAIEYRENNNNNDAHTIQCVLGKTGDRCATRVTATAPPWSSGSHYWLPHTLDNGDGVSGWGDCPGLTTTGDNTGSA